MTPQPQKLIKGKRFNLRECEIQIGIELIMSELGIVKEVRSISNVFCLLPFRRAYGHDSV